MGVERAFLLPAPVAPLSLFPMLPVDVRGEICYIYGYINRVRDYVQSNQKRGVPLNCWKADATRKVVSFSAASTASIYAHRSMYVHRIGNCHEPGQSDRARTRC